MREDRNVLDLLTANYTFVDELLAKHYGIPNVLGSRFRRVEHDRREPLRPAGPGQHSDADVDLQPHFAGGARQVCDGGAAGHAAAAASAECPAAEGEPDGSRQS